MVLLYLVVVEVVEVPLTQGVVEVVEVLLPQVEEVGAADQMCQVEEEEEVEAQLNLAEAGVVEDKHLVEVGVVEVVQILLVEGEEEEVL